MNTVRRSVAGRGGRRWLAFKSEEANEAEADGQAAEAGTGGGAEAEAGCTLGLGWVSLLGPACGVRTACWCHGREVERGGEGAVGARRGQDGAPHGRDHGGQRHKGKHCSRGLHPEGLLVLGDSWEGGLCGRTAEVCVCVGGGGEVQQTSWWLRAGCLVPAPPFLCYIPPRAPASTPLPRTNLVFAPRSTLYRPQRYIFSRAATFESFSAVARAFFSNTAFLFRRGGGGRD